MNQRLVKLIDGVHTIETKIERDRAIQICDGCGIQATCRQRRLVMKHSKGTKTRILNCETYVPVLSFQSDQGLDGYFNTFRRGGAWSRRVKEGGVVGLLNLKTNEIIGYAEVTQGINGLLKRVLPVYAKHNHMVSHLDEGEAVDELQKLLYRYYGKNYAAPKEMFSVIQMRKIDAEEAQKQGTKN